MMEKASGHVYGWGFEIEAAVALELLWRFGVDFHSLDYTEVYSNKNADSVCSVVGFATENADVLSAALSKLGGIEVMAVMVREEVDDVYFPKRFFILAKDTVSLLGGVTTLQLLQRSGEKATTGLNRVMVELGLVSPIKEYVLDAEWV